MGFPRRWLLPGAWYSALAVVLTWPAALHPVAAVPGAPRTDAADSLWSLWFTAQRLGEGTVPDSVGGLLNHPDGGSFWPADPLNGLLAAPLVLAFGAAATWTLLVVAHTVFAGLAAHRLGEAFEGNGFVSGTLYAAAPITLAHIHNGASEAVGGTGWLALAALTVVRLGQAPSGTRAGAAAIALALATTSHAYAGVLAFVFLASTTLFAATRRALAFLVLAGLLGALLAAGPAAFALSRTTGADNVVGIKTDRELATIRRTIGPADPAVFVHPGDFRSPNFDTLSRYGEELVHCAYLGWIPLLAAVCSLRRRRGSGVLWFAGITALVMAMGPVLVADGGPVILSGRRAVPLPYLLVESLPGFRSLSLLWRFAQLTALILAVLASRAVGTSRGLAAALTALTLLETRFVSPARRLPGHLDAVVAEPIATLAMAPDGAVMNYPVVGGRPYLYEQTAHGKPLTGTLNFPNNNASRRVWGVAIASTALEPAAFAAAVGASAQNEGVRYLVVHVDARADDDAMHTEAVRAIREAFTPVASSSAVRVYRFW